MIFILVVNFLVFVEKEFFFDRGFCIYRDFDSFLSKYFCYIVRVEKIIYLRKYVFWGDFFLYVFGKMYFCIFVVFVVIIFVF